MIKIVSNSGKGNLRTYGIIGLVVQLVGSALAIISIVLLGGSMPAMEGLDVNSPLSVLIHVADNPFLIGYGILVAVVVKTGVRVRYLVASAVLYAFGLFYKFAHHDVHVASGLGFGLSHLDHIQLGNILGAISTVTLAIVMLIYSQRTPGVTDQQRSSPRPSPSRP